MDDTPTPTGREMEILKVLWEFGPQSVRAVYRHLLDRQPAGKDLAYNTVQTLLRIMDDKGLVTHSLDGRAFVYAPRFSRDQSAARFLDRVFDGAASELVASLLQAERITPDELERLQALVNAAKKRAGR
ncbi:MAG: BlaI/MecI/CopY family transcriptional regulator [Gemmataceae bacterium]